MSKQAKYIAEAMSEYSITPDEQRQLYQVLGQTTLVQANERLQQLTGIRHFFPNRNALAEFRQLSVQLSVQDESHREREWGDYQTPLALAIQVCRHLSQIGIQPRTIIEPTYGAGNFILAALEVFPDAQRIFGIEIQEKYEWHFKTTLLTQALHGQRFYPQIDLQQDDIFSHSFPKDILEAQDLLIIGNPPWVTTAELGALGSLNLPKKSNLKGFSGLDAITGKSNFDIGEFIILRLLERFSQRRGVLAMLCKNSVIRNLVRALPQLPYAVSNLQALAIDARSEFNAAVDASLLIVNMAAPVRSFVCRTATLAEPNTTLQTFGWTGDKFVSDIDRYGQVSEIDGESPWTWRQGLKHDCAKVMELDILDQILVNADGQRIDLEAEWIYPLLKSSDLQRFEIETTRKKVIVTQRKIGDDTSHIQLQAPKLWQYLTANSTYFDSRKSSIYNNKPRFSIFGVGDYAFKLFKVAISGFYKLPSFSLVLPINQRAVMLDDTCYYLGFDTYSDALFTASLLNSSRVKLLLQSIVFTDAKRPYTKEALMRIDLAKVAQAESFDSIRDFWDSIPYQPGIAINASDYTTYQQRLSETQSKNVQLSLDI